MTQFIENKFKAFMDPTVGVEFGSKNIKTQEKTIKIQIWDTAGQENFRSITKAYFRGYFKKSYRRDVGIWPQ